MGQKINPTGFRLAVNKNWKSIWYADKKVFASQLLLDIKARKFLETALRSSGVGDIKIKRSFNTVSVDAYVSRPGVVIGKGGKGIDELKEKVSKIFGSSVQINVHEIKEPNLNSYLVVQTIIEGIQRRIAPKFLMSREIQKIKDSGALGAKIWVSGRIGGALIHRTEKKDFGSVPLHTLRANVEFAQGDALSAAGILGVKVWIYKGEAKEIEE